MATFKALNIESDSEPDDEIDNSKEIQIEEALKLYQVALRHHSEGWRSLEKALDAYKALFASEVFKYPESQSEFRRAELHRSIDGYEKVFYDDSEPLETQVRELTDQAPNTLPQILHLSYKNYGQFLLDCARHSFHVDPDDVFLSHAPSGSVQGPLECFAEALDKDDTDLDLWRRSSSVAQLAGSKRIARFCLESMLGGDNEGSGSMIAAPAGPEEWYAQQQLHEVLRGLGDDLSTPHGLSFPQQGRSLPSKLMERLNPRPINESASTRIFENVGRTRVSQLSAKTYLKPSARSWSALGDAIKMRLLSERGETAADLSVGPYVAISLPETSDPEPDSLIKDVVLGLQGAVSSGVTFRAEKPVAKAEMEIKENSDLQMGKAAGQPLEDPASANAEVTDPSKGRHQPPGRKRSTDLAGLPEAAEGGRSRSKRIRARESVGDGGFGPDVAAPSLAKQVLDQQQAYSHADQWVFEIVGGQLSRLNVDALGSPQPIRNAMSCEDNEEAEENSTGVELAILDLRAVLRLCTEEKARIITRGESLDDASANSRDIGARAFFSHLKPAHPSSVTMGELPNAVTLTEFARRIDAKRTSTEEVAWEFLQYLLKPGWLTSSNHVDESVPSSYMADCWPKALKLSVLQLIVILERFLYQRLSDEMTRLDSHTLEVQAKDGLYTTWAENYATLEMIQTLFELHLDALFLVKQTENGLLQGTPALQRDRVERWALLARDAITIFSRSQQIPASETLSVRHIWTSVIYIAVDEHVHREHLICCIEDFKSFLRLSSIHHVTISNNTAIPEISAEAADRELTRLSLSDFFARIYDNANDPVNLIESLEPILEHVWYRTTDPAKNYAASQNSPSAIGGNLAGTRDGNERASQIPRSDVINFVTEGEFALRLSLQQRLRKAYETIDFPPKVISCYLRSVEMTMTELKATSYLNATSDRRQLLLLKHLRTVDRLLRNFLNISKHDSMDLLQCVDEAHMTSSLTALAEYVRILQAFNVYEDNLRVGQTLPSMATTSALLSYPLVRTTFHEMQVRAWLVQYALLRDAMAQQSEVFPRQAEEKLDYLRSVHYAMGLRGFCKGVNMAFLKMSRDELLQLLDVDYSDSELSQVLYDLYGLKCFHNSTECMDHDSGLEPLDKKIAVRLLDFILMQARKVNPKELPKTELKTSIERVHTALGRIRAHMDITRNKKILQAYLKSAINPMNLYRCLDGIGSLSTRSVPLEHAPVAAKGWYFLMGQMALNRFRSQKRLVPGSLEELTTATIFYTQDLEFSTERWESWYRAAQAYDFQLEESVSWSAEKMNNSSGDIIQHQRLAIHCYTMAAAAATRNCDAAAETTRKMADMFFDFGMRIYASSRQPFSMEAFELQESEQKHYSGSDMFKSRPFSEMKLYTAWKFAAALFRRAITGRPDHWMGHYMLGKCLWKMHSADSTIRSTSRQPGVQPVIDAFTRAIETLPEKKDGRRDPILEPHYKLASVIHKLVQRGKLRVEDACESLQATHYARKVPCDTESDDWEWEAYILRVLKCLRAADKSGWHHRMIARAAHVIYDESANDLTAAAGAKHELTQQIFTKTMSVQVWKPEFERPGRHFVYKSRYLRFFVRLLAQLGDGVNLEMLIRKVRKKAHEFYEHTNVWADLCSAYLSVLRRAGRIPDGHEDAIFRNMSHEDFVSKAARVEAWCQKESNKSRLVDILRDTIDLKKLNAGLMKTTAIDDLIGDTYALLYQQIGHDLDTTSEEIPSAPPNGRSNMMSLDSLINLDGAGDDPVPTAPHPAHSQADQPPKQRIKVVSRRELLRKAETTVVKPAPAAMPIRPSPRAGDPSVLVVIEPRVSGKQEQGIAVESSAPGSVHDSADDESELSELEEEYVNQVCLPGLQADGADTNTA